MSARKRTQTSWRKKQLGPFSVGLWLVIVAVVAGIFTVYGLFFVRREVIDHRPGHGFAVSDPAFFGSAHALADPAPVPGNKIVLLHNGDEIFPALLAAIRGAKKSVNFEAFLFESGKVGNQFRDLFCEKARAGVRVRVLLDGVGSGTGLDDDDVATMKKAGCQFAYYHPTRSWRFDRTNHRTHRRILVIDGRVGFTGGVGFADQWQGAGDSEEHWRDVHARIEGPLVAKLQGAFQQHWVKSFGDTLSGPDEFPPLTPAGDMQAQVIAAHSHSVAALPLTQAVAIAAAEKRIWITNAYCTPSDGQVETLCEAVKRGVDVRLLVPGPHNDQPHTKAAGRTAYGKLLEGGVKIFEYEPAMIHSKTMVVDGHFAILGSSNLDARSAQINEELDVTVYDQGFGREMEQVFERDLQRSKPYTMEDFKGRSLWERLSEWAMIPLRSQL
jgi:cardiolipin synthase A/B